MPPEYASHTQPLPPVQPYRPVRNIGRGHFSARRQRIAWFLLGAVSGVALTAAAHWLLRGVAAAGNAALSAPEQQAEMAPELPQATSAPESASELPLSLQVKVAGGDTLINILTDTGLEYDEAHQAVEAIRSLYDPRKLNPGQHIAVSLDPSADNPEVPVLTSLTLPISRTETIELRREGSGEFNVKKISAPLTKKLVKAGGTIESSLYETGAALGIPASMLAELIKVYSYDVDFQRDIKRGHSLEVVFERLETEDGAPAGHGGMLYARLDLGGKELPVYRFTGRDGVTDYYNARGESLRKALLRTPVNGARISSGFGMRQHPVLGYSKMHRGVDFAAPTGTPIYAAGDGVVSFAGSKGAYGNYVQVKHNDKYATAYAHASRIASGIRHGMRVRQGQVIAYVGSTGRSTGPHLHYEVLVSGTQVNPANIKFKTGNTLGGRELAEFHKNVERVQALLKEKPGSTKVAMAESLKQPEKTETR